MAEVVNLRTVRKQKRRDAARRDAAAASARAGEKKAERSRRTAESELAERRHEGHRREAERGSEAMPDIRAHWDGVYGTKAEEAVSWFEADAAERVALVARHVPDRDAALLDVESGLSRLIPALVAAGYRDVTALDVSTEALAQARSRPGVEGVAWIVADVTTWRPERVWALWHDRAVLHFLTGAAERAAYLRALRAATGPGSVAILSAFAPDGPEKCSGLPVRRYGREEFEALLGPDFETVEGFGSVHRTPGGVEQRFRTHVARRVA